MRHRAVRPHTCAFLVALWVLVVMPPPSCAREGIFAKIKKSVKSVMGKDGSASIIVKQPTQVQHERAEVAEAERDRDARERDEGGLTTPSYERRMASTREAPPTPVSSRSHRAGGRGPPVVEARPAMGGDDAAPPTPPAESPALEEVVRLLEKGADVNAQDEASLQKYFPP